MVKKTTPAVQILKELCSIPTAPFAEHRVVAYVRQFAAKRPRLALKTDAAGNLLLELPGSDPRAPRWVYTAHMDHPGMVVKSMMVRRRVLANFYGWVQASFAQGAKLQFYDGDKEVYGHVLQTQAHKNGRIKIVIAHVGRAVAPGSIGMWDQGVGRVEGRKFLSRVCDDLAGAAAALAMLDELCETPPTSTVAVLLTRAEEEGFVGAIAASTRKPSLLRKSDRLIAIETSAAQTYAPQELGPIIRLGDKTSIFNSSLSYFLTQQADLLAKTSRSFIYQRAVMPGGTCEATVYDVFGFHAASICVALANYHNMDRANKCIAPEYIDLPDWQNMVRLFTAIARAGHQYQPGHQSLKKKLLDLHAEYEQLLKKTRT